MIIIYLYIVNYIMGSLCNKNIELEIDVLKLQLIDRNNEINILRNIIIRREKIIKQLNKKIDLILCNKNGTEKL